MQKAVTILLGIFILGLLCFRTGIPAAAKDGKKSTTQEKHFQLEQILQNGDILFQTSLSEQSKAIQLATHSRYSHMGIIYIHDGQHFVFEAVQPVRMTPLRDWIDWGENGHFIAKRLKNAAELLTTETLRKMKQAGEQYIGKNYDVYFEWTDDRLYCSELVWKIYRQATNIEIGHLENLSDFDLTHQSVQRIMKERYGDKIPFDEKVISPAAMFRSNKLLTVAEN